MFEPDSMVELGLWRQHVKIVMFNSFFLATVPPRVECVKQNRIFLQKDLKGRLGATKPHSKLASSTRRLEGWTFLEIWGFPTMGVPPVAGWFISWKIQL